MKKLLIIVCSVFVAILLLNYFYYKSLYAKQINYIVALLDRQVQIVGLSVDNTNNLFLSDLNQISFSEDLAMFFNDQDNQYRAREKMKLFFSKYEDFVVGIKLYDNNRNEFTLKKDDVTEEWLEQPFKLQRQGEIFDMEKSVRNNKKFEYYLPVIKQNTAIGNIVVTVDYQMYFEELFKVFNLKDYQWQWVLSDSGEIIYDNYPTEIEYIGLNNIVTDLANGLTENTTHKARMGGKPKEIISSYYSTQLMQRELGLIFSAPTDFFQKYIVRNSIFIVAGTLFLVLIIIVVFWRFFKSQDLVLKGLSESERILFTLIEEMPLGVIIHNKNREIVKANKIAADQYSFKNENEMKGKIFPETSNSFESEHLSKNLGQSLNPQQFVIIKKEIGEIVLYRNTLPIFFLGEECTMEILIDITMVESARKQEVKANVAKSEFLARMSYEIRTPLNGIIGMTDVLAKYHLTPEVNEFVNLLKQSTSVLLNIINDILDFSKIETGKMILDEIPFNLRQEFNYSIDLARTYINSDQLVLETSIDDEVPLNVIGDPYRLRQVLTNLLIHSIKCTESGLIRLKCGIQKSDEGIVNLGFELADTGLSFEKGELNKLFGDYVNTESKILKSNDDSGFGTILARQLIELMGGELSAESPSGISGKSGVKVMFNIINYTCDKQKKNLSPENITSFHNIKTLVITGTATRDEEILTSLHKIGLSIAVTTFQKSTIAQIKSNLKSTEKYKMIVILDDNNFDGFEAAGVLFENNFSSEFIILMISVNDKKGNYTKCVNMGIDDYLIKPFDMSELTSSIQKCFPFIGKGITTEDTDMIRRDIRILIVDDNKMNQLVLGAMLKNLGYCFDLASDGYEGYLAAKNTKYDLIFMDLLMPEMDGYQSAQKILAADKKALIVAFSANNMPESRKKAEMFGIKEFISKPVSLEDLKKLMSKYFLKV